MIPELTRTIYERFRDEVHCNKALYKSTLLYFAYIFVNRSVQGSMCESVARTLVEAHSVNDTPCL